MFILAITLLGLGILAFLDSIFAFGEIFRRVNAVMFLLVSLGLLFEIRYLGRRAKLNKGETDQSPFSNSPEPETQAKLNHLERSPAK